VEVHYLRTGQRAVVAPVHEVQGGRAAAGIAEAVTAPRPRRPAATSARLASTAGDAAPAFEGVLRALGPPREATARALVACVRAAAPHLRAQVKWNQPVWSGRGDVVVLQVYDDHINLGLFRGAELAPRFAEVEGTGKKLRHVKVADARDAARPRLRTIVRAAAQLDGQPPG
jgi:hypothetical protein